MRSRRAEIQQENGEHKCGGGSSSSHLCSVESAAACACLGPAQPRPHAHRSLRPAAAPRHLIMPCFTVQYPGFGTIGDPCARLVVATPQFTTCTPLAYTSLYGAILRRIDNSQNLRRHQSESPNRMQTKQSRESGQQTPRPCPRRRDRFPATIRAYGAAVGRRLECRKGAACGAGFERRQRSVDRTVRGCGPRSSSGSRAPGLAFRLDRTLISLDQTLISLDRTLITPSVCAASRHCAQRSQRHVLLSCRHVRCRLPARCPWYRLGLSLVLCRPRAHRVGSPTRRQV